MSSQTTGINGSKFETLESRVMLTGAFPSASQNAIIYDSKGNLDVAYYDSTAHNIKFVQQTPAGTWSTPTVIDSSSSDVGQYVTIALNSQGNPAVAYQDTANSDLKFAQYNGTSWAVATVDTRKTTGFNPSMTFDSQGEALISYYKKNTGDLILATHTNNKRWTLTTLKSAGNVGQFSSIAINPTTGKPAVAYTNASGAVQYTAKSKSGYSKSTTVATTTGASGEVSLAFGSSSPNIGYVNNGAGTVGLAQPSGKTFTNTTIATGTDGTTSAQVLIDPKTGMPAVVYHDSTGTYVAQTSGSGTTFTKTQVSTGGTMATAVIQPGSGSLVFSSVTTNGGTLSISTNSAPPSAPTSVAASSDSSDSATVTWIDNSDDEAGFLIERSTDGANFTTAGTVGPNITTYSDSGLTEGTTYYYRVSAIGAAGTNSVGSTNPNGSQIVAAAGLATVTTLAAAPSVVVATAASATSIAVTWTDNSQHEQGYQIARSADGGQTWTTAGTVGANVTTFTDTGLTEGTSYSYLVSSYNATGLNPAAAAASIYTLPAAPSGLRATATSDTAINLTWQNNSAVARGFLVQRSTDGVNFTTVATVGPTVTTYADTGLSQAFAYYYQILATGPGGQTSTPSASTNATTDPLAPSNVIATAISTSRIDLAWTDNSTGATNYIVQRASNGGAYADIATLAGNATSYSDIGRTEGISYTYRIQAITGGSASGFSAPVTSITLPAAPSGLTATSNGLSVTLSFTNNSVSATGFNVQRSSDNGTTWTSIATAPATLLPTIAYVDATAVQGATYSYQVDAINSAGHSATSNVASAVIAPAAPTALTATATSSTAIHLAWNDNSTGETGIVVERSLDGSTWTVLTTTSASAISYNDNTGLLPGTVYHYRISAINAGGASSYSIASGITAPHAPAMLTATPVSISEIDLSWTPAAGATSYLIEKSLNGTVWNTLQTVTGNTYSDLNLAEATQYIYRVTSIDAGGSGDAGSPVSATTFPAAPTGAVATDISPTSVSISWTNVSQAATALIVQRSPAAGAPNWTTVGNPSPSQTSFTDTTATEATSYIYQVQAVDNGGHSAFSTAAPVTTIPNAPTNLTATITSSTSVTLGWVNNSNGATSYIVERSIDNANFSPIGTPLSGTSTSYTDTTAAGGTQYWYQVYATDLGGNSGYSNSEQATTTPSAPQNVVAVATSANLVSLTWNAVPGATGYSIARSTDDQSFPPLNTSATNSYMDATATEGTQYWYTVTATNSSGSSIASVAATVTTEPAAPSSLAVISNTDTQVVLGWTNNSLSTGNFFVERSDDNGLSFSQIDTAPVDATTYTDTAVSEGAHYIYRVRAAGAGGESDASNTVGVDTNPSAPADLIVSANSATSVALNWTDVSTNATNYVVARDDGDGNGFVVIANLPATASSYTDGVTEGGTYQYEVRATQLLADNVTTLLSTWTAPQTVSTPPAGPTDVQAVAASDSEVDLSWTNNSTNASGFNIYRADESLDYALLTSVPLAQTSYQDLTVNPGTTYSYEVRAYGPGGESIPGAATPVSSIPAAPSTVTTSTALNPAVTINWTDVAGETGFIINRTDLDGQNPAQVGQVGQNVLTFTDTSALENSSYLYEVTAFNASGSSSPSQTAEATTFLAAPSGLSAAVSGTQVTLNWTDHSLTATGYEVQRFDGTTWTSLTTALGSSDDSFVDNTASDGVAYAYQVRALGNDGPSDFSPEADATTAILAPSDLAAMTASSTEVDLSWTNNSATATGYQILRSTDDGVSFQQLDAVAGSTTYADVTLTPGQSVQYEVTATNTTGVSDTSAPVVATALPSTPSGLTATAIDTGSIALAWTDNSAGATGYQIWRTDANDDTYSLLYTAGATATSYTDSGLVEASTYSYKIAAINSGGMTPFSNSYQSETYSAAPTNLTATTTASSATLTWVNNSSNANGYAVKISTDDGQNFNLVTASISGTATSYTVQNLTEATEYQFQVYAYDNAGNSGLSNTLTTTTVPNAPTLVAPTIQSDGVHLTWVNNSAGATGFTIQRSDASGPMDTVSFQVASDQTTYTDSTGAANTAYLYTIVADDAGGTSIASTTQSALTFPAAPTNFTAASTTSSSISLAWTPDANGADGYTVNRLTGGTWGYLGTADSTDSSYTDSTALAGVSYAYQLIANNASGSAATLSTGSIATLTAAPNGFAAASVGVNSVTVTWNDVTGETGFVVGRSTTDSNFVPFSPVSAGQLSYTDSTASEGTTYYYQVSAIDASGTGDASQAVSVLTLPSAPTALVAAPISTSEVDLSWTNHSQNATGYKIYRSTNAGPSMPLTTLVGNASSYNDLTAAAGTSYSYSVVAYNATGSSSPATQTALTIPGQVQNLSPIAASASEIDLTWSATAGAANYTVERSTDNINWTSLGEVNSSTLTLSDTGLTEATVYYYTVTASNATGSGVAAAASTVTLPANVTSLTASSPSPTVVNLTWVDNSLGATGYNVYRSTDGGQNFTLLTVTPLAPSANSYQDAVSEGTAYDYRVTPIDASGEGIAADTSITTLPAAPTLLAVTPASATVVNLTWANNSAHATGFTVERTLNGQNNWSILTSSLASTALTYSDTMAVGGTQYEYKVIAQGAAANSADSNVISALTYPGAVATVTPTAASSDEIDLTWTPVGGATSYAILRSTTGSNFTQIDSVTSPADSYQDTNQGLELTEGTRYYYMIVAVNSTGDGAASAAVYTSTLASAPTGLTPTVVSNHEIDLAWTNTSNGATTVNVERSTDNATWSLLSALDPSADTYQDTTVSGGTTYYYRVSAVDEGGTNYMMDQASVSALTKPDAPILTAAPNTDGTVSLSWTAPTGASTYTLQHSPDGTTWTNVVTATSAVSTDDSSLSSNTDYHYRILATDASGNSSYSTTATAFTVPVAPTNLTATAASTSEIDLTWAGDTSSDVSYAIYRADNGSSTFTQIDSVTAVAAYADLSVAPGNSYVYQVVASNAGGANATPASSSSVVPYPAAVGSLTATPTNDTTVNLTWAASSGATYYTVSRSSTGGAPYTLLTNPSLAESSVGYTDAAASGGTEYTYQVTAGNASGTQSVTTTTLTYPSAPTALTATVVDNHHISVQWTGSTGAASYTLQRSPDGGATWTNVSGISGTSVSDTVTGGGTYSYQVLATDATGNSPFAASNTVTVIPDAPTSVTATATSDTVVHVAWSLTNGATSYVVKQSTDNGMTYTAVSGTLSSSTSSYDNMGLTELTSYKYEVVAANGAGNSAASAPAAVVTLPTAPSALFTTSVTAGEVDLAWTDNSAGQTGFDVQRNDGITGWLTIGTTLSGITTYADTTVSAGTSYSYRVIADNGSVASAPTSPLPVLTLPAAPTSIVATASGAASAGLTWTAPQSATSFNILRSDNGGAFASVAAGVTNAFYTDNTISGGNQYLYEIQAVNATGPGGIGTSNSFTTIPAAQADFAATPISSSEVDLSWTDVHGATSYSIQRSVNGGNYMTLTSGLTAITATYVDHAVTGGTTYNYKIVGADSAGSSAATIATALTVPATVAGLSGNVVSNGEIDLSWAAPTDTITGFRVYRSVNGGLYNQVGSDLSSSASSLADTGLSSATQYSYELLAFNGSGPGAVVTTSTLTTLTDTPTNFTATGASSTSVNLVWTDVTGATAYEVDKSIDGGAHWTTVTNTLGSGASSYTDTGLSGGTSYTYRIEALDAGGPSAATAPQTALTDPPAPASVTATPSSATTVGLSWAAAKSATSYTILRSANGGMFAQIATGVAILSYSDTGASGGTAYVYEVEGVNATGAGPVATSSSVTTIPAAQTDFAAAAASSTEIDLTWTDVTGATTYAIERSSGGAFSPLAASPVSALGAGMSDEFSDTTVAPGTTYTYEILGTDATGNSTVTMATALTEPAAPTTFTTTPISAGEVDLSWDTMTGAASYTITRSVNGGAFGALASDVMATSYQDMTTSGGTDYQYKIVAVDASGSSAITTGSTVLTVPATQSDFGANVATATEVDLTWTDVAGATAYTIERSSGGAFAPIAASPVTAIGAGMADGVNDTTAAPGTNYTYEIIGTDATGNSVSTPITALTLPAAVGSVNGTVINSGEIDLTWADDAGTVNGYRVLESENGGGYSQVGDDLANSAGSLPVTGLDPASTYIFDVIAVNDTGVSSDSDTASLTTFTVAPTGLTATGVSDSQINLSWTAAAGVTGYEVDRSPNGTTGWALYDNTIPGNMTTYHDIAAAAGTSYWYRVDGLDAGGASAPSNVATALTDPAAPTTFTTTPINAGEVDLSWDAMTGAASYTITRSVNGGAFGALASDVMATTYPDMTSSGGTDYQYKIVAVDATGSGPVTTGSTVLTVPAAQTDFATSVATATQVNLTWTDVAGATAYTIERSSGEAFSPIAASPVSAIGAGMSDGVNDTTAAAGTNYTYEIIGTDATGTSAATMATALTLPAAVADVNGTVVGSNEINVTWTDDGGVVSGYQVYRNVAGGGFVADGSPLPNTADNLDESGLTEGTAYVYDVVAVNDTGASGDSDTNSVTTPLNSPTVAASGISNSSITITWTDYSASETGYKLEELTAPSTWTDITAMGDGGALAGTGLTGSQTVSGLTEATDYSFRVTALSGSTFDSTPTVINVSTAPNDPSAVMVSPTSPNGVLVTWTDNSANADGHQIQRSSDGGSTWSIVATVPGSAVSYTDSTTAEATSYEYEVAEYKGTSYSNFAQSASVATLPAAPTGLTATAVSPTQINLAWTDVSANATAYRVYSSTDNMTWTQAGSDLASNATSYNDSGVAENALTYFYVVAVDAGGESAVASGNVASATTPLAAPTTVTAATTSDVSDGDKTINLAWTNVSTVATNVKIERSSDGGNTWSPLTTLAAAADTYSDTTALENTTYLYRVWAVDGGVSSTHTASNSILSLLSRPTTPAVTSPTSTTATVTWTDVSSAATNYRIERSTDDMTFIDVGAAGSASATSFTDTGLTEGTAYYYRVRAISGGNTSNYSDVNAVVTIPTTPTGLNVTAFSTTEVDLAWTDPSMTATSYDVQRSDDGGVTWGTIATGLADNATTYDNTGLIEATDHEYRVFAVNGGGDSLDSNVVTQTTQPNTPTGLTSSASTASSVSLSWTNNSSGDTSYEVDRSTGGGWTVLTSSLPANSTSYTDSTAAEGTAYVYRVRDGRNGAESAYSSTYNVTTPPAAPSGLTVTSATSTRVSLSWTDNSNGETGFNIQRSTDNGATWSSAGTVAANSTTYNDNTVGEGLSYEYNVYAYNAGGNSTNSNTVTANIAPAKPTGLTASPVTPTGVTLTWTNNSSHQTGFYVQSNIAGTWTTIATVNSGVTYTVTTTEDTAYNYRVEAYGPSGVSGNSLTVTGTTPLNAPTVLAAATASTTAINLSWVDNSNAESFYEVQRSTDGGSTWTTVTSTLAANTTTYQDTGLTEGSTYTYQVQALRTGANSAFSGTASATTLPAAPSGVSGTANSDTQITVSWTNNSIGATGFTIQRSTDGGSTWGAAGTAAGNATSFVDTGLTELTTYLYRVEATDAGGASSWATAGAAVTTLPAAPSGLMISAPAADRIALTWTDNSNNATGYQIYRQANGGGFTLLTTLGASATTYTDLSVNEATTFGYKVRTVSNGSYSAYSNTASLTTVPAAPSSLVATPVSSSEIDLTWTDNSAGATHYLVERSSDQGITFTQIASLASNATGYHDTGLPEDADYQYQVRAQDNGGYSAYTNTAEAVTLLAAPTNLAAMASSGHIDLTWTNNSADDTGYTVMRSSDGGTTWVAVGVLGANSTSFSDTGAVGGLTSSQSYQYRVFCSDSNDGSVSANSNTVTISAI